MVPLEKESADAETLWEALSNEHLPLKALSEYPIPELETGQRLVAASPRFQFTPGIATSSQGNEQVHVEFRLKETEATRCGDCKVSDMGVLIALSGEERTPYKGPVSHSYVMSLPSVCLLRRYQPNKSPPISLMQLRINFGRILDIFPELLARAGLTSLTTYSLHVFVVAENE